MVAYTRKDEFIRGFRDTFPMVVGAIPFGLIFGALAISSGISSAGTMAMSLFVFAGSAQFIATGLIANSAGAAIIILTTLVVNLRHALYGATLSHYVQHLPQRWLLPLGFWLTDESFVIVAGRYGKRDESPYKHWYYLGSTVFMYTNWNTMTYIGMRVGQDVDLLRYGLDFSLIVTFIGMLIPLIRSRPVLVAAVVAGGSAPLVNSLPNNLGLIVATFLGITAGMVADQFMATEQQDVQQTRKPMPQESRL